MCACHRSQVLASLAEEPQEFAKGLEVLDSIVKIYTVFSRSAAQLLCYEVIKLLCGQHSSCDSIHPFLQQFGTP
jgi:hypothetical protein